MSGAFVKHEKKDGTITVKHDAKEPKHYAVDEKVVVTLNGDPSDLAHLKSGDELTYHGDPVTEIAATRS